MSNENNGNQKKSLSSTLKYFFGVGDAGFVLMSNIETFYFMTFLTDLAGFSAVISGMINSVFTTVDACLSWLYGGIINGTKAKRWGRYRSWLILVPWMVPFLYAFMFLRISDNEMLSAVVIIAAAILSHVVWNFGYVANATLVSGKDAGGQGDACFFPCDLEQHRRSSVLLSGPALCNASGRLCGREK